MTEHAPSPARLPLGAARIFGRSLAIMLRHAPRLTLLCAGPLLLSILVIRALGDLTGADEALLPVLLLAHPLLAIALGGTLAAGLTQELLRDARPGLLRHVLPTLRAFPSALPFCLSAGAAGTAAILLADSAYRSPVAALVLLAAFWPFTVTAVAIPAALQDGTGLRSATRSARLTRGYRWPILGLLLATGLALAAITAAAVFVADAADTRTRLQFALPAVYAVPVSPGYGLIGIVASLLHARLADLKEGDGLVTVFA